MNNDWIKIYTSTQFFKSEMVKQTLIDHEIEAVILNKQDQSYKFGNVEVLVQEHNRVAALAIISENDL
jgi:hypothetical protein